MPKSNENKSNGPKTNAKINIGKVHKKYKKSTTKAKKLIKDPEKAKETINKAIIKAEKVKGPLSKVWSHLMLMFSLVKDYFSGKYKAVPTGSLIAIIAGILYFVSPIDAIPDFIPVIGYIDDVFVLGIVYAQVQSDLEKYKIWKDKVA